LGRVGNQFDYCDTEIWNYQNTKPLIRPDRIGPVDDRGNKQWQGQAGGGNRTDSRHEPVQEKAQKK
jgi:hypothetical protein